MSQSESSMIREKLLVVRAQNRDEQAFHELVVQYERRILYYVHRLLGNDTDLADVMQDIWVRVFLRITTLRAPEAFRVWLYRIAHDVAIDHLRKSKRHPIAIQQEAHVAVAAATNDWNECDLLENAELVHATLERLSLPHREVLTLQFLEGLGLSEIAQVLGCSVGTVKSRVHYAKAAMRTLLEETCHE